MSQVSSVGRPQYYRVGGYLWKIYWLRFRIPSTQGWPDERNWVVKHYERRVAVGQPWEYVRGRTYERAV